MECRGTLTSCFLAVAAVGVIGWVLHQNQSGVARFHAAAAPTFVDESLCMSCHAAENRGWSQSHHALAMQEASVSTVRGDFSNQVFSKDGVQTRFFRRDGRFFVNTEGPDGHPADFEVKYTFGVEPLQQYLLELPRGRYQAFTIAWDIGGRRWFDLGSQERTSDRDELHWTQPSNNWNFMCAECHSTDVRKNYDAGQDIYRTQFAQINVGCQACHGPASRHLDLVQGKQTEQWKSDFGFAADPMRENQRMQIDACGRCHSRRAALSVGSSNNKSLLDTHLPELLKEGLYFADGQLKDEVYEYGSFLQSKMYAKGVRCSDCHEPHSLRTREQGNQVCTVCHNGTTPSPRHPIDIGGLQHKNYDSPAHHFHPAGSSGAQCVNCHMPTRTYMQVQERHDHSLRIPRPDLSDALETSDACTNCHRKKTSQWAAQTVAAWYGPHRRKEATYGESISAGRHRDPGSADKLVDLALDGSQAAIVRSTAISLLRSYPAGPESVKLFAASLEDPDPLVRRAAATAYELIEPEQRIGPLAPLLKDPVRAVRIEVARLLADAPAMRFSIDEAAHLGEATAEYMAVQRGNADRPESYLNLGNLYASRGDRPASEAAYRDALIRDSKFVPAYANLADIVSNSGSLEDAEAVLRNGLRVLPDSATLHHSMGLLLIRDRRPDEGLAELRRATEFDPEVPRFAYVYGVACHDLQCPATGVSVLQSALRRFPNDHDLLLGVASYAREAGDIAAASRYLERLRSIEQVHPRSNPLEAH